MADPSTPARPSRVQPLLSVIGGALMVAAYFLPDYAGTIVPGPPFPLSLVSQWDAATRVGNFAQNPGVTTNQPFIFVALIFGAPLLMGLVITALGVWGLVRGPGDLRHGFGVAAVLLALVSSFGPFLFSVLAFAVSLSSARSLPDLWLSGLGTCAFLLGIFLAMAAVFAAPRRAA